ncbi:MAG: ATP-binding protein [Halothiobacillaceae bacterium]
MTDDLSDSGYHSQRMHLDLYLGLAALVWTLTLGSVALVLDRQYQQMTMELARNEAEANFNKDQAFRFWATMHGGVYVEVSEQTPSNPFLAHVPERDLTTPSGRKLTLMNPAYMVRELNEQFGELFGVRGNITSLDPLRPANAPDAWEREALLSFEEGAQEVVEVSEIDERPYLRYMAPMVVDEGCLLCHAHQGYRVGDIRGGVSVAVPLEKHQEQELFLGRVTHAAFALVWLLGLLGILLARRRLRVDFRKQYEATLRIRQLNEGLEERVRERTAEVEAERERAEEANRAKSVFLANMSHELRTPLNAILGFSQLVLNDPDVSERQRENLVYVQSNGAHLLTLINDVLDMAKIEAGRHRVALDSVDLRQTLVDAVQMLRPRADEKRLELSLQIDPELPTMVRSDGTKLRQILVNLVSNAVKYTDRGRVRVEARVGDPGQARQSDPGQPALIVEVVDTGRGIAEDEIGRLFEPFFQSTRSGATEGTGLGLPITRQFVALLGGSIQVQSRLGEGSRFTVVLPLVPCTEQGKSLAAAGKGRVVGIVGDRRWRVLVVDDADANRILLHRMLGEVGFEIREASNGREAIDVFETWQPDFIWMDLRMPEMDGYEATRRIREMRGGERTVIAALTASSTRDEQERAFSSGCVALVRKPFRPEELFELMAEHLEITFLRAEQSWAGPERLSEASAAALGQRLASLPESLRDALRDALHVGDLDVLDDLVVRVGRLDRVLGAALADYLARFDFDSVLKMLDREPDS